MSNPNDNKNQFFQKLLQDYLTTESEIKMLNEAIKKRREKKNNLSESILTFIKKNNIKKINLDGDFRGHELAEKISKTTSISKDDMMSIFQNHQHTHGILCFLIISLASHFFFVTLLSYHHDFRFQYFNILIQTHEIWTPV